MKVSLLLASCAACISLALATTPVSKVLDLLTQLEAKIQKEGEVEAKMYKEYMEWCDDGHKDKGYEIKTTKSEIEDLSATIGKAVSDNSAMGTKVGELAQSISQDEGDLQAASQIRAKESAEFKGNEAELVEAVSMLDRAINILQRKMKGSASLMQATYNTQNVQSMLSALSVVVDAASLSLHDKKKLVALAQSQGQASDDDNADPGAPAADAYKGHGASIIDVLEDMREKAQGQLDQTRKEERSAKHNFAMLRQSLEDGIAANSKEMAETKASKARAQETKAVADGDLVVAKKELADDEESLANLATDCNAKQDDHDTSTKGRAEELTALAGAKKVISSMTGDAAARVYSGASFFQITGERTRSSVRLDISTRNDLSNVEVVNLVRQLAKKERSAGLMQLAEHIATAIRYSRSAGQDPFEKVRSMISDMISKLESEGKSEASHKEYCDKEMGASKAKMEELSASLEQVSAKKDKAMAASVKLKGQVQELQAELASSSKAQVEADALRSQEKKAFVAMKADLEQGIEGVRSALKILREYYSNKDEATSTHSKASGAGGSIVSMLEVIASDFGKNLATAEVDEDAAAVEYEKTSQMNRVTKVMKEKDVQHKTKEAAAQDKATSELTSDGESAQSELDAILEYKKGLIAACVAKPETYDQRKERRSAEIDGLREALKILEGQALFLQQHKSLRGAIVAPHNK